MPLSDRTSPLLPRGVWRPPITVGGKPVIMAVDDRGDVIEWVTVGPEDDVQAIRARLWALADQAAAA